MHDIMYWSTCPMVGFWSTEPAIIGIISHVLLIFKLATKKEFTTLSIYRSQAQFTDRSQPKQLISLLCQILASFQTRKASYTQDVLEQNL